MLAGFTGQLGLARPQSAGHLMALLPLTERRGSPTHASHGGHARAVTRSRAACLLLLAAALLFVGSFTFRWAQVPVLGRSPNMSVVRSC